MRTVGLLIAGLFVVACGPAETSGPEPSQALPPPIPEGVETTVFERENADNSEAGVDSRDAEESADGKPFYWGIAPGEPVPIMWEDLMPEGSMEDLIREQEAFYAMLQKRYMANASTLANADTFAEIEEGSSLDYMPQLGSFDVVEDLDGEVVRIPGYVVPFDFNPKQRHNEFLFVPYMGACIHTPPPPPNQIIYVRADPALRIDDIWAPYWLEGTLTAEQSFSDVGDAAYALKLDNLEPYPVMGANP